MIQNCNIQQPDLRQLMFAQKVDGKKYVIAAVVSMQKSEI